MWRGLHFNIIPPKTQVQSRDSLPNVTSACVLITMHVCGCVQRLCYTVYWESLMKGKFDKFEEP